MPQKTKPLHLAFDVDFKKKSRELITRCRVSNPYANNQSLSTDALWDTGATGIAVSSKIVRHLMLHEVVLV